MKGRLLRLVATERPIATKEVAEMLGVTPRTVTRLAERGEIPGFKVGDVWRFHRQDILDYIEEQKRKQRPRDP
jgi:excisionase family DNA binding protein